MNASVHGVSLKNMHLLMSQRQQFEAACSGSFITTKYSKYWLLTIILLFNVYNHCQTVRKQSDTIFKLAYLSPCSVLHQAIYSQKQGPSGSTIMRMISAYENESEEMCAICVT